MTKRWSEAELRAALDDYEEMLRRAGKARNTIATYVQHPERFINWLGGDYIPRPTTSKAGPVSKYDPLRQHLESTKPGIQRMTFGEIERTIGAPLPESARRYRPWWANEEAGTHTHARAWLEAGWKTRNVDLTAETVEFIR